MKIKSITISNFGPFYGDHTLELDPCVTVLAGPNDCGKTILLDALACTE
jgi:DNA repair exonuclease SbcCD ATPase subunit